MFFKKENRQTLLFSATFPDEVQKLADDVLKPGHVMLSTKNKTLVSANTKVVQSFISVSKEGKKDALLDILKSSLDAESPGLFYVFLILFCLEIFLFIVKNKPNIFY